MHYTHSNHTIVYQRGSGTSPPSSPVARASAHSAGPTVALSATHAKLASTCSQLSQGK